VTSSSICRWRHFLLLLCCRKLLLCQDLVFFFSGLFLALVGTQIEWRHRAKRRRLASGESIVEGRAVKRPLEAQILGDLAAVCLDVHVVGITDGAIAAVLVVQEETLVIQRATHATAIVVLAVAIGAQFGLLFAEKSNLRSAFDLAAVSDFGIANSLELLMQSRCSLAPVERLSLLRRAHHRQ
jgi:hypothetical protein